ncbi:uncharacterized protein C8Q71DRAFT_259198 [Rhodofomes roseus]|uniref:Uncharacterized protein n=1 Tax=Rhodofomes roseus TaxID=34475 RepID=A0ABQ8K6R3_9APHY|nr:uncharacterized protein C8Q71DRAFT_259198 [Rhodofomes roseus]KAH9832565.1 hypothetical protein C8Q71DRAFT_259198 [Rhodofomes roseus]
MPDVEVLLPPTTYTLTSRIRMPRKKRSSGGNGDKEQNDGHRRLPTRIPDSPGYVHWATRTFGRTRGGPASVPTGVSSEIDFSLADNEGLGSTESSPVSSAQSSLSPTRTPSSSRGRGQRRSGGQDELPVFGSISPITPSSEGGDPWSPPTAVSPPEPSGPSPRRDRFSPSRQHHSPLNQQGSPTRQQYSATRHQGTSSHPQHSPDAPSQHYPRYHPYRQPVVAPRTRLPPGSHTPNLPTGSAVGSYPAPEVGMPPVYGYTGPVTDDAQQWPESSLGFSPDGSLPALDTNFSYLNYLPPTMEEQVTHVPLYMPQQPPFQRQNIPRSSAQSTSQWARNAIYPSGYLGPEVQTGDVVNHYASPAYPQQLWETPTAYGSTAVVAEHATTRTAEQPSYQWSTGQSQYAAPRGRPGTAFDPHLAHPAIARPCRSDATQSFGQPLQHRHGIIHSTHASTIRSGMSESAMPLGHDHSPVYLTNPYAPLPSQETHQPQAVYSAPPSADASIETFDATSSGPFPSSHVRRSV